MNYDEYEERELAEMAESAEEEKLEQRWLAGNQAAYRAILLECARHLGGDPQAQAAALVAERVDAIASLRRLCNEWSIPDNWPDDLHLADIIDKHITPYVY